MKDELRKSLRHMQEHPTTGTPHNQQLISTQVETIFMLDELSEEIRELRKTIDNVNVQSDHLARSNYNLQIAMLILTGLATAVVVYPAVSWLFSYIISILPKALHFALSFEFLVVFSTILSAIIGVIVTYGANKVAKHYSVELHDSIHLKESGGIIVRDKDGRIKEERTFES